MSNQINYYVETKFDIFAKKQNMNLSRFIAQRIQNSQRQSFTSTVTKIGIASIAIGLAVMIVSFSILIGFKKTIQSKLFTLSSHIQVSKITLNQSFEETPMPINTNFYIKTQKKSEIRHIQAVANKAGLLKSADEHIGVMIKGVGKDYDWNLFKENLIAGRTLQTDSVEGLPEIIISKKIADKLRLKLNQEAHLYFIQSPPRIRKVKIVGIYDTGLEEFDKNYILGNLALVQKMNNWEGNICGHYEIYLKEFETIDIDASSISKTLDIDQQLLKVTDMFPAIFEWLGLMDRNILIIIILILLVAGFNMISVLLVMMMERTPMIGILKALGATDQKIRNIFVINGIKILVRGLVIGNILGIGLSFIQKYYQIIPLEAESYYMNFVPIELNWQIILLLNVMTSIIVSAVITIPTFIVSKMNLVDAIKFKK